MASPSEVLLLFSYETYPNGRRRYVHHADILNDQRGTQDVHFNFGALVDLQFSVRDGEMAIIEPHSGKDIADFDLVCFQKWSRAPQYALAAAVYLQHKKVEFVGHEVLHQTPLNKLPEMSLLVQNGLPYIDTFIGPSKALVEQLDQGVLPFTYPFILKDIGGTQGKNNHLVEHRAALVEILEAAPEVTFMAQAFIANDCDYRVAVMGGEAKYVLRRTGQAGSHLNNTSQGGSGEFMPLDHLPQVVMEDALKAAAAAGRSEFAGVDVLVDKRGRHYILEVNWSMEIQTGFGVAQKSQIFIDYIMGRLGAKG